MPRQEGCILCEVSICALQLQAAVAQDNDSMPCTIEGGCESWRAVKFSSLGSSAVLKGAHSSGHSESAIGCRRGCSRQVGDAVVQCHYRSAVLRHVV